MGNYYDYSRVAALAKQTRQELQTKSLTELVDLVLFLKGVLLKQGDKLIGAREVAEMFNRKKSWVYAGMRDPRTTQLKQLRSIAIKMNGTWKFRFSEVVEIRERIFHDSANTRGDC